MYNGIGLASARGSSTNGFIQRNLSYIKTLPGSSRASFPEPKRMAQKSVNQEVLLHNQKRAIALECLVLEEKLVEEGVDEDEVILKSCIYWLQVARRVDRRKGEMLALIQQQVE